MLETFANQAVIAIQNARLFKDEGPASPRRRRRPIRNGPRAASSRR